MKVTDDRSKVVQQSKDKEGKYIEKIIHKAEKLPSVGIKIKTCEVKSAATIQYCGWEDDTLARADTVPIRRKITIKNCEDLWKGREIKMDSAKIDRNSRR